MTIPTHVGASARPTDEDQGLIAVTITDAEEVRAFTFWRAEWALSDATMLAVNRAALGSGLHLDGFTVAVAVSDG